MTLVLSVRSKNPQVGPANFHTWAVPNPDRRGHAGRMVVLVPRQLRFTGMTGNVPYYGGRFTPPEVPTFAEEIARFHETLAALSEDFGNPRLEARITEEQFLQGPLSDAMTHAGQLAMLRRLHGSPVASENFIFARVRADNVTAEQPEPEAPDAWWRPEEGPKPPGTHASKLADDIRGGRGNA